MSVEVPHASLLFESKPVRNLRWEVLDGGQIVLLVPRIRNQALAWLLRPLVGEPCARVCLDAVGSYLWMQCDGGRTVREIAARVRERFGGEEHPLYERVGNLMEKFARERFVTINQGGV